MNYLSNYIKLVHLKEMQETISNLKMMLTINIILNVVVLLCMLAIIIMIINIYKNRIPSGGDSER